VRVSGAGVSGAARTSGARIALVWVLTRVVVLIFMFGPESRVVGDVGYFAKSLRHLGDLGLGGTMREYPLPAVAVVALPWALAGAAHALWAYGFFFVAGLLAVDAAFTVLLHRQGSAGQGSAVTMWLVAVPAMGGLTYVRFDLVPGVLVGVVILLAGTRPRVAALLVAVATSIKLWPVLLVPPLLARAARRGQSLAVVAAVGATAVLATVVAAGWARVWSPLAYQADRGLQIESVAATPAVAVNAFDPAAYRIFYSSFKAYEITGPGVPVLLTVSSALSVALVAFLVLLWSRIARLGRELSPDALVWASVASTLGFLCASKVLSPQYLLWVLPMAVAGLTVVSGTRRALGRFTVALIVAAALSHAIFPTLYSPLVLHRDGTLLAVAVLVVRNLLLVALLVQAGVTAVRLTARGASSPWSGDLEGAHP
jgi:hypothetical protein